MYCAPGVSHWRRRIHALGVLTGLGNTQGKKEMCIKVAHWTKLTPRKNDPCIKGAHRTEITLRRNLA